MKRKKAKTKWGEEKLFPFSLISETPALLEVVLRPRQLRFSGGSGKKSAQG